MVVTILVVLFLISQVIAGYRIGFSRRIFRLVGLAVTFFAAVMFNEPFSNWLRNNFSHTATMEASLFDQLLYKFLAFIIILIIGRILVRLLMSIFPASTGKKGIIKKSDALLGAIVSLIIGYITVFLTLSMLNSLQFDWFIQQTIDSKFLQYILYQTPILSQNIFNSIFGIEQTTLNL